MTGDQEIVQPFRPTSFLGPGCPDRPKLSRTLFFEAVWGEETGRPGTGKVRSKNWEGLGRKNRMSRDQRS